MLTANASGKIVSWALPACKAEWVAEVRNITGLKLTPGGKYLAGLDRDIVRLFDVATGPPAGDLDLPQTFPAGKVIVREGDTHGVGFFVVAAGEGVITVKGNEVGKVGPGSYFGEVALISDRVRTATVTATTDLECLVMTFWDFRAFVRGDAEVAWKLLEHVGKMLHSQS